MKKVEFNKYFKEDNQLTQVINPTADELTSIHDTDEPLVSYQESEVFIPFKPKSKPQPKSSYRDSQALVMQAKRKAAQDIGQMPLVVNQARKDACKYDLLKYMLTYHKNSFTKTFSETHIKSIKDTENIILHGGKKAEAMPRGSGKTTMNETAMEWAINYGHRKYIVCVVESGANVEQSLNTFKGEYETNELLLEDFPEICFPIQALEGNATRANGQTYQGKRTFSKWGKGRLVFPTISGSDASGSCFEIVTIERVRRGLKHKPADGKPPRRPDLVIIDDPQNDESASSDMQCNKREKIITGTILGLAGQDKKIAVKMACTIIKENDLADRFLSREKHPEWQGEKHSMIINWPTNMDFWGNYRNIYLSELENQSGQVNQEQNTPRSNGFYIANRTIMDEGMKVMWEGFHYDNEISDKQHVMNRFFEMGIDSFSCECQNMPTKKNTSLHRLNIPQIMNQYNGFKRGVIPQGCYKVVCCADINYYAISWAVVAYREDFCGYVVDYGFYPGNGKDLYDSKTSQTNEETSIFEGLVGFTNMIAQKYPAVKIIGIDGNRFTQPVYKFCYNYQNKFSFLLYPLRGHASSQYKTPAITSKELIKPARTNCHLQVNLKYSSIQDGIYDSHYWHLFMQRMFLLSPGAPKSISLFGDSTENHRTFAEQICTEVLVDLYEHKGKLVYEWQTSGKNEFSDVLTMCTVIGNLYGLQPDNIQPRRPTPRKQVQVRNYN